MNKEKFVTIWGIVWAVSLLTALFMVLSFFVPACEADARRNHDAKLTCIEEGGAWNDYEDSCMWSKGDGPNGTS